MGAFIDPYPGNGIWKSFTKSWHSEPYSQISPTRPELSAKGKVVFITGGGTGIGKATAIAFAQAGAKAVAIFGRRVDRLQSAAEEIRKANPDTVVVFESVDLTKFVDVQVAFQNASKATGGSSGKVDVFMSNAGVLTTLGNVAGYGKDDLDEALSLNLKSAFYAIQAILPLLEQHATVLNITSGIAHINSDVPGGWAYAMTKAATTKMFDFLQAENPDLRVFNVQPGVVDTEINAKSPFKGQDDIKLPAHFHTWLASPEADFLKGKFVWVNWDVEELKKRSEEIKESLLLRVLLHGVPM